MNSLNLRILKLRRVSLFLFLVPSIALVFSLLIHNFITEFNLKYSNEIYEENFPVSITCDKKNKFCSETDKSPFQVGSKFDQCNQYIIEQYFLVNNDRVSNEEYNSKFVNKNSYDENKLSNLNIESVFVETKEINNSCILNSNYLKIYKIFPSFFYFVEKIKNNKKYSPGTSGKINPFVNGETSISNIVKRYPIDLIFKPLLYLSSLLMILYWLRFDKVFREISNQRNFNKFTYFGIASSIFLFFHVLFLGTTIDNEIFNKIRRLILVLFILSEIIAQFLLTRSLYLSLVNLKNYIFKKVLNFKILFVSITVIFSIIILIILSVTNLSSKIDYILEWNYFLFLLFFYLLSAVLWKKNY